MSFTDVFGGDTLYPADLSYRAVTLTASTTLQWPTEASAQTNLVAAILDVTASAGPLVITMPPATEVSTGTAVVFNNVGANTFVVNDNGGTQILSVASGLIWTAYVTSNSTAAGTWETYQNGAGTSSATAAALAGYGIKAITTTLNQSMPVTLVSTDFTADATYRAGVRVWTGGAGVASLTAPATLGDDWFTNIKNSGTGNLVLTPLSGTIDGQSTVTLSPDESAIVVTDGSNFYTIGLTPIPTAGFDFAAISIAGSGNYTLAGTELNRISYSLTGILTGDRTVIIPTTVQQYWITNNTTGNYNVYVKTSAQTSVVLVKNGETNIIYCNGTDAVGSRNLPQLMIAGLITSNNGSDPNNDIDIASGMARDSTNVVDMVLRATLTKRLDAAWAVGTNQGGLDTGVEATSTMYAIWLIMRLDTGVVDALFSTSFTAPTMPANYSYKRLIGAIYNNGAGNINTYRQVGDYFRYFGALITDVDDSTITSNTYETGTASAPPWSLLQYYGDVNNDTNTAASMKLSVRYTGAADAIAGGLNSIIRTELIVGATGVVTNNNGVWGEVLLDGSRQFEYAATEAAGTAVVRVVTYGFKMLTRSTPV